ncbi:hypothetical protein [Methylovulum psychrotolerans]|uniref:Uncharacterized protein n=1 Tax=Methylovulum psychrotolerans TaxID=1704499 RepID=A0A2S5CMV8_9GAMM|nr:hypothetical protein [Methylovulum psychrotolerans]POZ52151.1 hypothetical protein AADEFJLK_01621 [Methylovulum psychrotolerans]
MSSVIPILTVADALVFAKTSTSPFIVQDSSANIGANADALVKLAGQLLEIDDTDTNGITTNAADFLALAPKIPWYHKTYFNIQDNSQAINSALAAPLYYNINSLILPDNSVIAFSHAKGGGMIVIRANQAAKLVAEGVNINVNVFDSSANITANADGLAKLLAMSNSHFGAIYSTDGATIYTTATDFIALATHRIFNQSSTGSSVVLLNIKDTVAAINATVFTANFSVINSLILPDGTVIPSNLSATYLGQVYPYSASMDLTAQSAVSLAHEGITSLPITVSDSSVNISANADVLAALGSQLIEILDSDTDGLTTTAATYSALVGKTFVEGASYAYRMEYFNIKDTPQNINAFAATLNQQGTFSSLILPDGSVLHAMNVPFSFPIAPAFFDAADAIKLYQEGITALSVAVYDSSANISANADALVQIGGQLVKLEATDTNGITANVADFLALAPKIDAYFNIEDSVQAINAHAADLLAFSYQINSLTLPDGSVYQGDNQNSDHALYFNAADTVKLVQEGIKLPINVIDSADNISANANTLAKMGAQLVSVVVSDIFQPITVNAADFIVLAPKNAGFNVYFSIKDSVANINAHAAKMAAHVSQVDSLILSDGVVIESSHFFPPLGWPTTEMDAQNAAKLTQEGITAISVDVQDFSSNISVNAHALAQLGKHLVSLNVIYDETPITINTADFFALVPKALIDSSNTLYVTINDTAQHIAASLNQLQTLEGQIDGITFTDSGTPTLAITAKQYTHDSATLAKLSTAYHLSLNGETAAHVAQAAADSHVTAIAVTDTAAHVYAKLNDLASHADKLSGITLTDAGTPTLTLNGLQAAHSMAVLDAISSPYLLSIKASANAINNLDLSGVQNAQIELEPTLLKIPLVVNTHINSLNLSLIDLSGDTINETAYGPSGVELDIIHNGATVGQLFFAHNTSADLQLLGVDPTIIHVL